MKPSNPLSWTRMRPFPNRNWYNLTIRSPKKGPIRQPVHISYVINELLNKLIRTIEQ